MQMLKWIVLGALVACGSKEQTKKPATATPPVNEVVGKVAAPPHDTLPAAEFLPARLAAKEGVIFAEAKGGMVEGIADGTRVEIVDEKEMGVGDNDDGAITIKHGGKTISVKPDRVIREDGELKRSPDRKFAVFAPMIACGDVCHTAIWIVAADGRRANLGEGGVDVYVAWHPNGATAAVGNGTLTLVSLADFTKSSNDKFLSPAYAPDGTLYVRDSDGSAYTLDSAQATRVWKAKKRKHADSDELPDMDPRPVGFKNGKPKFDL
jgi:hypothetical protein